MFYYLDNKPVVEDMKKPSSRDVILPDVQDFPSPGIEYKGFPADEANSIINNITQRVFANIYSK